MPSLRLNYHIVWATKHREPVLKVEVERIINQLIRLKVEEMGGETFALDGLLDHRHFVGSSPAKIEIARFVGQMKGFSTAMFNRSGHPAAPVYWQTEYSAFPIDQRSLKYHIEYVQRQKFHHAQGTTVPVLEKICLESGE